MLVSVIVSPVVLLSFFFIKSADALLLPLVNGYVNDHVGTAGRATTLSAMSMLFTVTKIPLLTAAGALADNTDIFVAVAGLGAFFVVATSAVLLIEVPEETTTTNTSSQPQSDQP